MHVGGGSSGKAASIITDTVNGSLIAVNRVWQCQLMDLSW